MLLDQLPLERDARITRVDGRDSPVMLRLMEMGLLRGSAVRVRKRAPFRGPLEIEVEGYLLSIRHAEARRLSVELVEPPTWAAPEPGTDARSGEPSGSRSVGLGSAAEEAA